MITNKSIENIWQELHEIPEPAFKEQLTTEFASKFLREAGYDVKEKIINNTTGIVATLDSGKKGSVVGLRTDMDCLMFDVNGKQCGIHACGHDAHMSIVLSVAKEIATKGIKKGKVKIIMQPAEEIGLGAKAMLNTGLLDDLDYLFGLHLMPQDLAKSGQIVAQVNWTACTLLTAEITGKTAHGSMPHLGINAINIGCAVVEAINSLQLHPLENWNVKATRFETGTGSLNAICDKAVLGFDLRATKNSVMEELYSKVCSTIKAIVKSQNGKVKIKEIGTCPGSEIDSSLQEIVKAAIIKEVGTKGLVEEVSTTVGEDFNFYKQLRPKLKTGFLGLGCNLTPCLHDRNMTFDHSQLIHGANTLYNLVNVCLNK